MRNEKLEMEEDNLTSHLPIAHCSLFIVHCSFVLSSFFHFSFFTFHLYYPLTPNHYKLPSWNQ
jgi:hypothetical protein